MHDILSCIKDNMIITCPDITVILFLETEFIPLIWSLRCLWGNFNLSLLSLAELSWP